MKNKLLSSAVFALAFITSQASATSHTVNTKAHVGSYNLILSGDLTYNSHVEGKILIGGDINGSGTAEVGSRLTDPNIDAVTVLGDIGGTVKAQNGTNIVYGTKSGAIELIGGGTSTQIANPAAAQANFDAIWNQAVADSTYFSGLTATGNFNTSDMNNKKFENNNLLGLNVFNINSSAITSSGAFQFTHNPSVPVVINVAGTGTLDISSKAFGNFNKTDAAPLVLWNFFEATAINFSSDGWNGSVLAPNADINLSTGSFDGGLLAKSLASDKQLHNELYTYTPPGAPPATDVPAPAGALLMGLGLLVMISIRLKK